MPKVEAFMEIIQKQILEKKLSVGDKLPPERELSETYGYSRQTVHNGLLRLSEMKLLKIVPRQGVYVKDYISEVDFRLLDVFVKIEMGHLTDTDKEGIVSFMNHNIGFIMESVEDFSCSDDLRRIVADLIIASTTEEKANHLLLFFRCLARATNNIMCVMMINGFGEGFKKICLYTLKNSRGMIQIIKLMEAMIINIERGLSSIDLVDQMSGLIELYWKES